MRRALAGLAALAAVVIGGLVLLGGSSPGYQLRAYFDTAGFLVAGEQVRVAGATVGTVEEVDVAWPGEPARSDGSDAPGKAVAVLRIDDPAFQDFRADASCLIRPQSLLGEKYVECRPTMPRAPGSEPAPPLEPAPEGTPAAGQRVLALERNGKQVDLDLVQNIMELPYRDRFRIILNELGAGLAARGDELARVIERANPALRETDRVLAELAEQRRELAGLAEDADTALAPLRRERGSIGGFLRSAETTGRATAERLDSLEPALARMPAYLRELGPTMASLRGFATAATPLARDLDRAAPTLARSTRALRPFSRAADRALVSLGEAAAETEGPLVRATPVLRRLRGLGSATRPAAVSLDRLLTSFARTGGDRELFKLIYNSSGAINGYDSYGHFLRTQLLVTNCVDYVTRPLTGCGANWARDGGAAGLLDFLVGEE